MIFRQFSLFNNENAEHENVCAAILHFTDNSATTILKEN